MCSEHKVANKYVPPSLQTECVHSRITYLRSSSSRTLQAIRIYTHKDSEVALIRTRTFLSRQTDRLAPTHQEAVAVGGPQRGPDLLGHHFGHSQPA